MNVKKPLSIAGLSLVITTSGSIQAQEETISEIHSCLSKNTSERSFPSKTRKELENNTIINIDRYDSEEQEKLKQEFLEKTTEIALDEYFCKTGLDIQNNSSEIIKLKQEVIELLKKLSKTRIFGHTQIVELEKIERRIRDYLKTL